MIVFGMKNQNVALKKSGIINLCSFNFDYRRILNVLKLFIYKN